MRNKRQVGIVWQKGMPGVRTVTPAPWFIPRILRPDIELPLPWFLAFSPRLWKVTATIAGLYLIAWLRWPAHTFVVSLLIMAPVILLVKRQWANRRHKEQIVRPMRTALADILSTSTEGNWLTVPRNLDDDEATVTIQLPPRWQATDTERAAVSGLVSRRLPGSWEAHWDLGRFQVSFTHPPPPPKHVEYDSTVSKTAHIIPIAQGARGAWIKLDLLHETPHVLISAPTGWGKSSFFNICVSHIAAFGKRVDICDPKRIGFRHFKDVPNITIHTDVAAMAQAIHGFRVEMDEAYAAIENGEAEEATTVTRALFLDELGSLITMLIQWWRDDGNKGMPPVITDVLYILWRGRAAGYHLFAGAQQANARVVINSDARDQYGAKIAAGPQSQSSWAMLYGRVPKMATAARKGACVVGIMEALTKAQLAFMDPDVARARALAGSNVPTAGAKTAQPAHTLSSVPPVNGEAPTIVGREAGAAFLHMTLAAFSKARVRTPIAGEVRVGNQPAWTESVLLSWQSKRPRAGGTESEDVA